MKTCSKCQKEKPLEEFPKNKNKPDGYQYYCKVCARGYDKVYYDENPERRQAIKDKNKRVMKRNLQYVRELLNKSCCAVCGEDDPIVLEFDHIRGEKENHISQMARDKVSVETLQAEISKCQILCANCHRRKTAKQFGWNKLLK